MWRRLRGMCCGRSGSVPSLCERTGEQRLVREGVRMETAFRSSRGWVRAGRGTLSRSWRHNVPGPAGWGSRGTKCRVDRADLAVIEIARWQHAVVGMTDLAAAGLGRHAIAHRTATGWLRPMFRGVYLVGPLETPLSRPMGAVLAAGTGAVLSHGSAAVLWSLRSGRGGPIDVTVPGRKPRAGRGSACTAASSTSGTRPASTASPSPAPAQNPARPRRHRSRNTSSTGPSNKPRRSARSHCIPSMSSSSATPATGDSRHCANAVRTEPELTRSKLERRMLEQVRAARLRHTADEHERSATGRSTSSGTRAI